jgi:prepilin-type N-terminal cleavage/methylation domain-containing protein
MRFQVGFTIAELLVVISIIGVLASFTFGSFGEARDTARNRAIQSELKEVQLALEVFRAQNGAYPEADSTIGSPCDNSGAGPVAWSLTNNSPCTGVVEYIVDLAPDYIATLPRSQDSGNSACVFRYEVEATDQSYYKLTAENCFTGADEAAEGIQPDTEFSQCPSSCGNCDGNAMPAYTSNADFYETMAVYSAGGECL